jgi:hypothetical protein
MSYKKKAAKGGDDEPNPSGGRAPAGAIDPRGCIFDHPFNFARYLANHESDDE